MAQHSDTIHYGPMLLTCHSPGAVAHLIYESAPELFSLLFGSRAIACLTKFVGRSHNRFSHRYIQVAAIHDQVVGMVVLIPAASVSLVDDYDVVLSIIQRLRVSLLQRLLLRYLLRHDYPDRSFYIGNLAVAVEYRNQGIGRQLLSQCIAEVEHHAKRETNPIPLFISVDVANEHAQKLYESLGFEVVDMKAIRLFGKTIGSRILSLSVPQT